MTNAKEITKWILQRFPSASDTFGESLVYKLTLRLSIFFLFPPATLPEDDVTKLMDHHRTVKHAPAVLQSLSAAIFVGEGTNPPNDEASQPTKIAAKSRRIMKEEAEAHRKRMVDSKVFSMLKIDVPSTRQDANRIAADLRRSLRNILELYFRLLSAPEMAEAIIALSLANHSPAHVHQPLPANNEVPSNAQSEAALETVDNSTGQIIQPPKSAVHFDNVEGFGKWRILISSRADGDLRDARRRDKKTFLIIVKKIRELSNGHFSDDNQKRLNAGSTSGIPIFEAKMTRDSRLVYQIDCVPQENDEVLCMIKVLGIYTHAQLDNRLWDVVARELGKKGSEYKHRCTVRERPPNSTGAVFVPASFPPLQEDRPVQSYNLPDLPRDNLSEVHSLLALEKFVQFSKPLLHSMLADLDVVFPFQVSSHEQKIINHPYSCYVLGRSGTGKTTTMLFKMLWIERAYMSRVDDSVHRPRQVFVTKSRVLADKVAEYFLKLVNSLHTITLSPAEMKELANVQRFQRSRRSLTDIDEDATWRSDLPKRFSQLSDEHFPLIITSDNLSEMLEADIVHDVASCQEEEDTYTDNPFRKKNLMDNTKMVTYDVFVQEYWLHFSQTLTKGLQPSLVFNEIMGIICGSEEALLTENGYLDATTYESLSGRTQSAFAGRRRIIYNIFQLYQKQKRERGHFDAADRTHRILRALANSSIQGRKIDYLYVDEAQDNLLIDALLLRFICHNADGLFWAGDTAQTISIGSAFRFDDLKAFLFRVEKQHYANLQSTDGPYRVQEPPAMFQLTINYRSHGGIVNCANSIIDLITRFWPYAIDKLAQERGIVNGIKPIFLSSWDRDSIQYDQFLFGETGALVDFGAHQCILVRDDSARDRLQQQVGKVGVIMTLYESKGLEFNDVLLYNFFEDSPFELSQWRVVLNAVDEYDNAPRFEESRHGGICSELKSLYVAITRARNNVWIADCSEKGEPMRIFWDSHDQIQSCQPGGVVPQMALTSTSDEWEQQGQNLFDRKIYGEARHCFIKAGVQEKAAVANAYEQREIARKMGAGMSERSDALRHAAFSTAADCFMACSQQNTANRGDYLRIAAKCFEDGNQGQKAAELYLDMGEFKAAATVFAKLGLFEKAIRIIRRHKDIIPTTDADAIINRARITYFNRQQVRQALDLFDTLEEALAFSEERDLDIARTAILISLGRYFDAAEVHLSEGRTKDAIQVFLKDNSSMAVLRAGECIVDGLWKVLSLGVVVKQTAVKWLLKTVDSIDRARLTQRQLDEILMFRYIVSQRWSDLRGLGETFHETGNREAALLCFDHFFTQASSLESNNVNDFAMSLRIFLIYANILRDLAHHKNPCIESYIWKLCGFQKQTDGHFLIPMGTILFSVVAKQKHRRTDQKECIRVGYNQLRKMFTEAIGQRLLNRVIIVNDIYRKNIRKPSSCSGTLPTQVDTDPTFLYNIGVEVHLLQVLINQTTHQLQGRSEWESQRRYWIERLYDALNPFDCTLGTLSDFDPRVIPDVELGFRVVKKWIHEAVHGLDVHRDNALTCLSTIMLCASLAFVFDPKSAPIYLRQWSRRNASSLPPKYISEHSIDVLAAVLGSLEGLKENSIINGIYFLYHALDENLPLHVGPVCNLIEGISALLIVNCWRSSENPLHPLSIPRSWIIKCGTDIVDDTPQKDTSMLWAFIEVLLRLLQDIEMENSTAFYFLDENEKLVKICGEVRDVFITRICICLALLGVNIPGDQREAMILSCFATMKGEHDVERFSLANDWADVKFALLHLIGARPLDEMLKITSSAAVDSSPAVPGVTRLVHSSKEELRTLLKFDNSRFNDISSFARHGPSESATVPPPVALDGTSPVTVSEDVPKQVGWEEVSREQPGSENVGDYPKHADTAASLIQKTFRMYNKKLVRIGMTQLAEVRIRFWETAMALDCKDTRYRLYFLGPLPHLWVSLQQAKMTAVTAKTETKELLRSETATPAQMEELDDRLTAIVRFLKDIKKMQAVLQPTAKLHSECNINKLKTHVRQALLVLRNSTYNIGLEGDIRIVDKGILQEPVDNADDIYE
ncbi:hypothetical protein BDQ12DRAFT_630422 [Crucibulum laeve]|uniref:UvrD-like helicase ATP-binding domain-containing protein n=1 Tax=Crucibulum laeve TaxID=68775 RepID=A0A5C3M1Q2_9AGAR|nr:hypothetical protein BDQ12DRAFT_630422 [Crucibulum laeve]